ncbi:MAG: DUF3450 domain-containing protein [Myxococcota bacterium]|nr:DUF3450 domain-containing protein [Myxococcota bacterium]
MISYMVGRSVLPSLVASLLLPLAPATWADEASSGNVPVPSQAAEPLDAAQSIRQDANIDGIASQKRIDVVNAQTDQLFSRYTTALRQIDSLRVYNRQMRDLIVSQEAELVSLSDQIDRVEEVGRSVTPLMLRMIAALDTFVGLDTPFLEEERAERIAELHALMARADVSNAEKYRNIMEAYQIENEYGRTIEAYRSNLNRDGKEVTVDFLRFGRIALVYQTLDGNETGVWDPESRSWVVLDNDYRTPIRQGLRIARKQSAPDLIRLPLPAATAGGN